MITTGSQQALDLTAKILINPNDFIVALLVELINIPGVASSIRHIPFTLFDAIFIIVFPLIAGIAIALYVYI